LIDITSEVESEVQSTGIKDGICIITTPHTSAGIIINENETGLCFDILNLLNKLVPPEENYQHNIIDTNAEAHLKAVLLGSSEVIPVVDGKLEMGRWQSLFFAELDGPRQRNINVIVIKNR
jgi:secondary thiamine-phosphate synthase enzyme